MKKIKINLIISCVSVTFAFLLLGVILCFFGDVLRFHNTDSCSVISDSPTTVIIDAGHGGEDCGAIGVNGVFEKDINFAIATELAELLSAKGISVILTRTEDKLLYTEAQNIKGQRKQFDLRNRLKYAEDMPEAIFISIHMNNFNMESCRGMQVYYSSNTGESRTLAQKIQDEVVNNLQPYNTRKIKETDGSIYLLDNAVGVAVLVECGFLSNTEECEKLSQKDYQSQLSFHIFCGIMDYIKS